MNHSSAVFKFSGKSKPWRPAKHLRPKTRSWCLEVDRKYELSDHHRMILQAAAEAWDRIQEARDIIAVEGMTFKNAAGEPKKHPAVQIENDNRITFARLIRELALDVNPPTEEYSRLPAVRVRNKT